MNSITWSSHVQVSKEFAGGGDTLAVILMAPESPGYLVWEVEKNPGMLTRKAVQDPRIGRDGWQSEL